MRLLSIFITLTSLFILALLIWAIVDAFRMRTLINDTATVMYQGKTNNAQCFVYGVFASPLPSTVKQSLSTTIHRLPHQSEPLTIDNFVQTGLTPDQAVRVNEIYLYCRSP